jgi:hypothetical protein
MTAAPGGDFALQGFTRETRADQRRLMPDGVPPAPSVIGGIEERALSTYRLVFPGASRSQAKTVEFEAEDASYALVVANREAGGRAAELWEGDRMLCKLRRMSGAEAEFWEVSSE